MKNTETQQDPSGFQLFDTPAIVAPDAKKMQDLSAEERVQVESLIATVVNADEPDFVTVNEPANQQSEGQTEGVKLPILGTALADVHQKRLGLVLAISLVLIIGLTWFTLGKSNQVAKQVSTAGDAVTESQRLAKSISQAVVGNQKAFKEMKASALELGNELR